MESRKYSLIAVIGPENSRLSLDQSHAKLKQSTPRSPPFSHTFSSLVGFSLSSHWLLEVFI